MKSKSLVNATFLFILAVSTAEAHLACFASDDSSQLVITPLKEQRTDAEVRLIHADGTDILFGAILKPSEGDGFLYQKKSYKLFAFEEEDATLTITTRKKFGRGGCGRGGCDDAVFISALFEQSGTSTEYSCHEAIR